MGGAPADGHPAGAGPASLRPWGPLSFWHPGHTAFIPRVALTAWRFNSMSWKLNLNSRLGRKPLGIRDNTSFFYFSATVDARNGHMRFICYNQLVD